MMMELLKPISTPVETVKSLFRRMVNFYSSKTQSLLHGAKYAAKRAFVLCMLVTAVLWLSVLLYASFHHIYVPSSSLVRPAYFKFRVCPAGVGMCSFPVANVTLSTESQAEMLGRGQQYRIILRLEVPDSVPNRDVGMFMVVSRLYDKYGVISQESSRAVTLKYQSDLLKLIQTMILSPLYISGFTEETQTLHIELFSDFWDDFYQPAIGILLEIHSRQLAFYSAQIQFHACYSGLRYYLFYYPLTSAFFGIIFNILWVSLVFVLTWYRLGLDLLEGNPLNGTQIAARGQEGDGGYDDGAEGMHDLPPPAREEREGDREPRNFKSWGNIQPFTMLPSATSKAETIGGQREKRRDTTATGSLAEAGIPKSIAPGKTETVHHRTGVAPKT